MKIALSLLAALFMLPQEPVSGWKVVVSGTTVVLRGVFFADAGRAWAVGDRGTVMASANGGRSWKAVDVGAGGTLRAVHFADADRGWIVGDGDEKAPPASGHVTLDRANRSGTLLRTSDGGRTWTRSWVPTNFELRAVAVSSKGTGLICSHGGDDHPDGDLYLGSGTTAWTPIPVYRGLDGCCWLNEKEARAVGSAVSVGFLPEPKEELYVRGRARIVATPDGGRTWTVQDSGKAGRGGGDLRAVAFSGATKGLVSGDKGTLLRTSDGGATWEAAASGTESRLNGVCPAGWVVGDGGIILGSPDEGKTWRKSDSPVTKRLLSVAAAAWGRPVIAVGEDGTVLRLE